MALDGRDVASREDIGVGDGLQPVRYAQEAARIGCEPGSLRPGRTAGLGRDQDLVQSRRRSVEMNLSGIDADNRTRHPDFDATRQQQPANPADRAIPEPGQ